MSIASQITTMQEHIEDIYDTFAVAGVDTSAAAKNIVNINANLKERLEYYLANGLDVVWNNWNKVSGSGTTLSLNNTIQAKMDFVYKGNTYQETTTGKNLFDNVYGQTGNVYTKHIDASSPLGSVDCYPINLLPNTQYTLKIDMNGYQKTGTWIAGVCFENGDVISLLQLTSMQDITTTTFTTDSTGVVYVGQRYGFTYGETGRMDLFLQTAKIQLEKGTTATGWEKYSGGNPTPNPDYPQDVQVVTGDNEVKVENINLCSSYRNGTNTGKYANGLLVKAKLKPSTYYEISFIDKSSGNAYYRNEDFVDAFSTYNIISNGQRQYWSFKTKSEITPNSDGEYLIFKNYQAQSSAPQFTDVDIIEVSSITTESFDYEPYQSQTYPIYLGVENLFDKDSPNIILNKYLDTNGDLQNATKSSVSDYIKVLPNTIYSMQPFRSVSQRLCFYDSSKTFLSSVSLASINPNFTTPNNCEYIRTSFITNDIDIWQIEKGSKTNHYTEYGTTPIELCKIGDYQDRIFKSSGKNLFDKDSATQGYINQDGTINTTNAEWKISDYIKVIGGDNYTYQGLISVGSAPYSAYYDENKTFISSFKQATGNNTITIPNNAYYVRFSIRIRNGSVSLNDINAFMINEGSTSLPYEPYGKVWYLNKQIGKVVLNGSESWSSLGGSGSNPYYAFYNNNTLASNSIVNSTLYANYFITDNTSGLLQKDGGCRIAEYNLVNRVFFCIHSITSVNAFKTWLSTHNTIVYYVLATPTITEITDTTLIEQLDNLEKAYSYDTQTNISQTNADKPFILDVTALKDLDAEDTTPTLTTNRGLLFTQPPVSENFINDEDDNSILEETINEEEPNIEDDNREEEEPLDFFEKEIINNDEEQEEIPPEPIEIDNGQR